MVRHHLPPEHATPARSYLAAFLGEREATDAMHEVVDDVTYWGDDSLPAVLAAAHSVLVSRLRVSPDAAASWLVDELGLDPDTAAKVAGAAEPSGREAPRPSDEPETPLVRPAAAPDPVADPAPDPEPDPAPDPVPGRAHHPAPDPAPDRVRESSSPLRIGFEDDRPLPSTLFDDHGSSSRGRVIAGGLLVGVLVLVAILLLSR